MVLKYYVQSTANYYSFKLKFNIWEEKDLIKLIINIPYKT